VLPRTVADITAEWLTEVLSKRHPGVVVTALKRSETIAGTGTKVVLDLTFNDIGAAAGVLDHLVLKGGFTGHQYTEVSTGANEARFYRDIAPRLTVNIARCEYADFDSDSGLGIVAIEDLRRRPVEFGRATKPVSPDTAAAMVSVMAAVHAAPGVGPHRSGFPVYPDFHPSLLDPENPAAIWSPAAWATRMQMPVADSVPHRLRDHAVLEHSVRTMWKTQGALEPCLIHGDTHLGNWFFDPARGPGLIDWQQTMSGPWTKDFQECIVASLEIEDRRAHERDLLALYLQRRAEYGARAPSFDDAWLAYRRSVLESVLWAGIPEEMQPADINAACTERGSAAVVDLDTLASLGV
jgi:Phosphotransferase enzyme family